MNRRVAVVALLLVATAGCTSTQVITPGPNGAHPSLAKLIAKADLHRCPTSRPGGGGGLPSVTLQCLGHGPAVNVAGLSGTPSVVTVWASWCTSCGAELGYLARASDQLGKRVQFLGVDTEDDPPSAVSELAATTPPVRFPSVVDPGTKVLLAMHQPGPPATALVNAAGQVVYVHHGAYANVAAVRADIATYLHVAA